MSDKLKKEIIEVIKGLTSELKLQMSMMDYPDKETKCILKEGYDLQDKLEDM